MCIRDRYMGDAFIQRFQTLHFVESITNGLYFDGFVPRGCMAIKQKAQLKDEDATVDLFCFGRIESDFEDFFNQVKEQNVDEKIKEEQNIADVSAEIVPECSENDEDVACECEKKSELEELQSKVAELEDRYFKSQC
eukprot:TRINITY_DN1511_c0_g1_i1.p4 TRINITY_DN1511_c0_g1~~TRINITY_DN1511_c0_g1_i1.p4  ORF type:complete len:137 (-),score=25.40 TRINITY_DN1511_c0_g1_i1:392-802(-)